MAKFDLNNETVPKIGNYFHFSAANVNTLGSTEYTIVGISADNSGSVNRFAVLLNNALKEAIEACKKSPRADNLLLRVTKFDDNVEEFHGFKEFRNVNLSDYDNVISDPQGMTALRDAGVDGVDAICLQAKDLYDADYSANGIFIQITDGADNKSKYTSEKLRKVRDAALQSEQLESMRMILVGVNPDKDASLSSYLEKHRIDAGFDQYIEIEDTSAKAFAKLADFISKSISTQSTSLGSGSASVAVGF